MSKNGQDWLLAFAPFFPALGACVYVGLACTAGNLWDRYICRRYGWKRRRTW